MAQIIKLFPEPPVDPHRLIADAMREYHEEQVRLWSDSCLIALLCDPYASPERRGQVLDELAARGPRPPRRLL